MTTPAYFYGTGRRKTAIARVRLIPGSGEIVVNDRTLEQHFGNAINETELRMPFRVTGTEGHYHAQIKVEGGGVTGQAGAIRHGIARALTEYNSLSFSPDGSRLAPGSEGESKLFDTATGQVVLSFKNRGLRLAFARDGQRLLAVHAKGASVFYAPAFEKLQFVWMKARPSAEAPPYLGPNPNYVRPDRP